jgi:hypothetical protein
MHPQLDLKQISIELLKVFNKLTFPVTSLQEVKRCVCCMRNIHRLDYHITSGCDSISKSLTIPFLNSSARTPNFQRSFEL